MKTRTKLLTIIFVLSICSLANAQFRRFVRSSSKSHYSPTYKPTWSKSTTSGTFHTSSGKSTKIDGVDVKLGTQSTSVKVKTGKDKDGNTTDILWGKTDKSVAKSGAGHEHSWKLNSKESGSSMNQSVAQRQAKNRPNWDKEMNKSTSID